MKYIYSRVRSLFLIKFASRQKDNSRNRSGGKYHVSDQENTKKGMRDIIQNESILTYDLTMI